MNDHDDLVTRRWPRPARRLARAQPNAARTASRPPSPDSRPTPPDPGRGVSGDQPSDSRAARAGRL